MSDLQTTNEWLSEPNKEVFISNGLLCVVKRHEELGHLCGYVGVPVTHPCCGKGYNSEPLLSVQVHGGVTFSGINAICDEIASVSYYWWIGFDCAHFSDYLPSFSQRYIQTDSTYRNIEFVRHELDSLSKQLSDFLNKQEPI